MINKLNYINNSQVLEMIADVYNLNQEEFADSFAENCNSVSYGDADFTLVNQTDYIAILLDAIFNTNKDTVLEFNEAKTMLNNEIKNLLSKNNHQGDITEELINSFYINLEA